MFWNNKEEWLCEVVPHAGTWIEIGRMRHELHWSSGRSPRGNVDWNSMGKRLRYPWASSFPTRERGLKLQHSTHFPVLQTCRSPRGNVDWNRGLSSYERKEVLSFPTRERGLKYGEGTRIHSRPCRSPRGNVDWNTPSEFKNFCTQSRSPRGNVDWNFSRQLEL